MALTSSQVEQVLARLMTLIPEESDQTLLTQLINDAAEWVQAYTSRTTLPDILLRTVGDLALIAYNRRGTEGESGRSEGGESYSFETAPQNVYDILNRYRLAKVGGAYYEKAETDQA